MKKAIKAVISAIVKSIDWRTVLGAAIGAISTACAGCKLAMFNL